MAHPSAALAASNFTWTPLSGGNASGSWATQANWSGGVLPTTSIDTANLGLLNITADSTVTLDGSQTIKSLIFGDSAGATAANWILSSGSPGTSTLILGGTTPTITVNPLGTAKTATINAVVDGSAGLTKGGSGPLTLTAANTYTGTTTITAGTLTLNGQTGTLISTDALTFGGSGVFNYDNAGATGALSQSLGALTFSAGDGTVKTTYTASQNELLTFSSLAARTAGATANFSLGGGSAGAANGFVFGSAPSTGQLIDRGLFYGGGGYAAYDLGGFVRAYTTGDANYASVATGATMGTRAATDNVALTGSITLQTTANGTVNTINMGANNITMNSATDVLSVNGLLSSGSATATLGGSAAGTTGFLQPATTGSEMVVRVNGSTDKLTIKSILQNNGASASILTKTGAGTLVLEDSSLNTNNTYSGGTFINAGTVQMGASNLGNGARTWFGPAGSLVTMMDGAALTSINDPAKIVANGIYLSSGFPSVTTRDITLNGVISGPGGLTIVSFSGRGVGLPIANSFTGGVKLQAGGSSGGEVRLSSTASVGAFGSGTLRVESSNGPALVGNATLNGGVGVPNPIDLAPGAVFTVTPNGGSFPILLSGAISGNGALTKNGVGSLTLSGVNTYTGGTTVSYGLLTVSGSGTFGSGAGNLTASGGILDLNAASWNAGLVTISGGTIQNGTLTAATSPYTASKGFVFANLAGGAGIGLTMNGSNNMLVLSGTNTYGGATTITAGTLLPTTATALPNYATGTISVGASGTLLIKSDGWAQSEISALLNNPNLLFTAGGTLAIDTGGGDFASSITIDPANLALTKMGSNTMTLSGANTYPGATKIAAGAIKIDAGAGGSLYGTAPYSALTFNGTGTFNYDNTTATSAKAQNLGTLTFATGEGTVQLTRTASQTVGLTFSSLAGRSAGASRNFVISGTPGTNGTDSSITLTGQGAGFIDQGTFFNGSAYAWMNGASPSYVRGINYSGDAGATTSGAVTSLSPGTLPVYQEITGAISGQNTASFTTLAINGNNNVTLAASQTVSVNGILKTGNVAGGSTISGGTGIQTVSSGGEMVVRTDGANDSVTISTPILANGASLLTKSGAGALTLSAANTLTTGVNLNAGTLNINNAAALGIITTRLTINAGTTLDNTSGSNVTIPNKNPITVNGSFTYTGTTGDLSFPDDFQNGLTINSAVGDIAINVVANTLKITSSVNGGTTARIVKNGNGTLWLGNNGGLGSSGGFIVNAGVLTGNKAQPDSFCGTGPITLGGSSGSDNAIISCGAGINHGNAIAVRAGSTGILALSAYSGTSAWGGPVTLNNNLTLTSISGSGLNFAGEFAGAGGIIIGNSGSFKIATTTYQLTNGGTIGLFGNSSYTGNTVLKSGTLQLGPGAAPNSSALISIAAGATLDASLISTFTLGSSTTLSASGTGTASGSTQATFKGGTSVNLSNRPISLTLTPTTFTGDITHPALVVSQGSLTLNGNVISVMNNAATPLGAGVYRLIQVTGSSITGVPSTAIINVTGAGLVTNGEASASVSSGNVILTVVTKLPTTFSGLTLSQTINHGTTTSISLHGTVSATGPVYPAAAEPVHVTIAGNTYDTTVDGAGYFTISFPTSGIPASVTPYPITYSYGGSTTLKSSTDSTTALTVTNQTVPSIYSWPTASGIAYGQSLSASTLTGGSAEVSGTFTFTAPGTTPLAGTYPASGTFTPDDTFNFSPVTVGSAISVAVAPLSLTVSGATVTYRPYTGTTAATITGTLNGLLAGDVGQVVLVGTGTFQSPAPAPGIGIPVTAACTLSGSKAGNYILTQPTGLAGDITSAVLTVKADDANRPVGAPNPVFTYTISGYQNGENATTAGVTGAPVLSTTADISSPEGAYAISCATGTLAAPYYIFTASDGTLTVISSLKWAAGNGTWDINTSLNWKNSIGTLVRYADGVPTLFDDTVTGAGPFTVTLNTTVNPGAITINANKDYTISGSGVISGSASLTKTGSGILTISGANAYSGGTTVNAGTLSPYGNGSGTARAFFGSGSVTMAAGTTLKATDATGQPVVMSNAFVLTGGTVNVPVPFVGGTDLRLAGVVSGAGSFSISGGARWLNLTGNNTFSGGVIINDGNRLEIGHLNALGTGTVSLGNPAAGSLETTTNLSTGLVPNTIDLTSGRVLSVVTSAGSLNLSGTIQNTGSLVKNGSNTLTLSGTNTYSGTTTVAAGTLLVNGTNTGSGAVSVASAATLGGTGGVGGNVTYTNGALANFTKGSPLVIAGTLTLNDNIVHVSMPVGLTRGNYTLATYNATGSTGAFNATPVIDTGSPIAGATATVTTGGGFVKLLVNGGSDYDAWANNYVGYDLSNPGADTIGNGLTNAQKYAFGLNPTSMTAINPIKVLLDKTAGTFTYTRRATPAITGIVYTVWTSPDLAIWTHDTGAIEGTTTVAGDVETVPVTLSGAPLSATKWFVRVEAAMP